jgi:hypothetical protein
MTTRIGSLAGNGPSLEGKPAPDYSYSLSLFWRIGLSALLLYHVLAVFLPPFQFASGSPFANALMVGFRPYSVAMYLDHGYFFFAPDPGPSHLVDYKVEFADGRAPVTGRFPDLQQQQPRLKYHRHFMIAEALNNQYVPLTPPPEPSPPPLNTQTSSNDRLIQKERSRVYQIDFKLWQHRRQQYEALTKSIEAHLVTEFGGSKATISRIEHRLLSPFEVKELGLKANDPTTYVTLPETPLAMPRGENR